MDYLQQCIDLRRQDIEPEMFAIALAARYIRRLINHGGSDMRRPDLKRNIWRGVYDDILF